MIFGFFLNFFLPTLTIICVITYRGIFDRVNSQDLSNVVPLEQVETSVKVSIAFTVKAMLMIQFNWDIKRIINFSTQKLLSYYRKIKFNNKINYNQKRV